MYQVSIINNGVETVIHSPNPSKEAPHIKDMNLKIVETQSSIFEFKIHVNHTSYGDLVDLVTKIKIIDISNNKIKFEGRVLVSVEQMDSAGIFYKDVTCESELGYLNDSRVGRWELHPSDLPQDAPNFAEGNYTIRSALQKIIDNHNNNVDADKRFALGNVEVNDGVYLATNYESSLEIIISKIINSNGLVMSLRNENGIRYLDVLLDNPTISNTKISLRKNLKEFMKTPDYSTFCTRLIGIGADGLTFEDINNGKNYVEDALAIAKFGIITKPFEWKDVTIKENLLQKANDKLADILNDSFVSVEVSALDLSYIGLSPEEFEISTKYIVENDVQNYSNALKVVAISLGLSEPWNSSLTFSNMPVSATNNAVGIQQQVNSNRIEVLTYNDKLIQKISNTDGTFASYREQTDKAILERVTSIDYESYKTQTAQDISQKVSHDEFGTELSQNYESVRIAWNAISQYIEFSNGKLYAKQPDGSYFELGVSGIKKHVNGVDKDVHYLSYVGACVVPTSTDYVTITLPDEFKGKTFAAAVSLSQINNWTTGYVVHTFAADVSSYDYDNGRFTIHGGLEVINIADPNTIERIDEQIAFTVTA